MNWRDELEARHPKIFPRPSAFSIGRGWEAILDVLCERLQAQIDRGLARQIVAREVKQKYAELRFEYDYSEADPQCAHRWS
jgi:hypothetical protein